MNEVFVCYGDCQAESMAMALKAVPEIVRKYEVLFLWAPVSWVKEEYTRLEPSVWARCTVLWQETGVSPPAAEGLACRPPGAKTVTFPPIWLGALWPFSQPPDIFAPEPNYKAGRYPYNDPIMMKLAETDLQGLALSRRYDDMAEDMAPIADRMLDQNMFMMTERDDAADVSIGSFIMARFGQHNMFSSANHPRSLVLRELLNRLAAATWPEHCKPTGPLHRLGDQNALLNMTDPLRLYDHPVSRWVASHWGLRWWSETVLFRIIDGPGQSRSFTFDEYLIAHIGARRSHLAAADSSASR